MKVETPEPGIYEDVPFSDYLQWDAFSASRLSLLAKSPRHCQRGFSKEPSPAMQLGSLYHCGVLEPLLFADRYAIAPDYHLDAENCTQSGAPSKSTTTKYVKDRMEEFRAITDGREVVPRDWYLQTLSLVKELTANEDSRRILNGDGPRELSILWQENGLFCKARIDKVCYEERILADLKSCANIEAFPNSIGRFGYHRQMAHYQAGWKMLTGDTLTPWLIAVESSDPYTVQAAPLHEESLALGHANRAALLDTLWDCLEAKHWPPMPNPTHWHVPAWAAVEEPVELIIDGESIEV